MQMTFLTFKTTLSKYNISLKPHVNFNKSQFTILSMQISSYFESRKKKKMTKTILNSK